MNALDKIILTEIDSLDRRERGCYASNKSIAEFCQCSETKVSTAISKLIKLEYIYVQKFDGRQRELKSRLSNFERQNFKTTKCALSFRKSEKTVIDDIYSIPENFLKYAEPKADLTEIKKAIKNGEEIKGAHLEETQNIQIK